MAWHPHFGNPRFDYCLVVFLMQAWDKYFNLDVSAHAPVLLLPVSETSAQAFMLDLGSISIKNMLLPLDEGAGIEAYGINLDSLKVSRYSETY